MKKALFLGLAIAATVIVGSLFVPVSTLAHAETCPVAIQDSSIKFTSQADKPISAVIFHALRVDAVGEEVHPDKDDRFASLVTTQPELTYTAKKDGLQPGQKAKLSNNFEVYPPAAKGLHALVYVRAVKFMDGSTWKDDGSHACKWERQPR